MITYDAEIIFFIISDGERHFKIRHGNHKSMKENINPFLCKQIPKNTVKSEDRR